MSSGPTEVNLFMYFTQKKMLKPCPFPAFANTPKKSSLQDRFNTKREEDSLPFPFKRFPEAWRIGLLPRLAGLSAYILCFFPAAGNAPISRLNGDKGR